MSENGNGDEYNPRYRDMPRLIRRDLDSSDTQQVQDAIDAGQTVVFHEGHYFLENVVVRNEATILCDRHTEIECSRGGIIFYIESPVARFSINGGIWRGCRSVVDGSPMVARARFRNMIIRNVEAAFRFSGCSGAVWESCFFESCKQYGIRWDGNKRSMINRIRDCEFISCQVPIEINNCVKTLIDGCYFNYCDDIKVEDSVATTIVNSVFDRAPVPDFDELDNTNSCVSLTGE